MVFRHLSVLWMPFWLVPMVALQSVACSWHLKAVVRRRKRRVGGKGHRCSAKPHGSPEPARWVPLPGALTPPSVAVAAPNRVRWPCACVPSRFGHFWPFVTLWIIAHQFPLSMRFSRHECWSGLPCPSPGDLPNQGSNPDLSCLLQWHVGSLIHIHVSFLAGGWFSLPPLGFDQGGSLTVQYF